MLLRTLYYFRTTTKVTISDIINNTELIITYILSGFSGVWGLKKNFALLELIEKIQTNDEKDGESIPLFSAEALEKERKVSGLRI